MPRSKLSIRAYELVCGPVLTDEELLRSGWYPVLRTVFENEMNMNELKTFIGIRPDLKDRITILKERIRLPTKGRIIDEVMDWQEDLRRNSQGMQPLRQSGRQQRTFAQDRGLPPVVPKNEIGIPSAATTSSKLEIDLTMIDDGNQLHATNVAFQDEDDDEETLKYKLKMNELATDRLQLATDRLQLEFSLSRKQRRAE